MLLSALILAAALQAAPPVAGQTGYLPQRGPFETDQSVAQPRQPFHRKIKPSAGRAIARILDPSLDAPFKATPPRAVARNPMMASCGRHGLERAGGSQTPTVQPLSRMPPARAEYAVARLIDGCPVASPIAQRTPAP
jgi:hypothetical protein